MIEYPVQFSVDYRDRPLNRLSTAFRVFLVIPLAITWTTSILMPPAILTGGCRW
jgi:hypothetical protein